MFPVLFGNNELIEKQRFVFTIPFVTNGANGSPGPKANLQRIIQDNAEGVSTLLLVVYDTRLWYLTQLGGNGQRRCADRGNCQRYSVKCLLMGHSSVFHCTVKHRELNKNRKTRECIQFFDTRDSHGKTKMLRGIVPNLSVDDYSYQRDLVPVSPKGEWWKKSLILPTVFSGKDRPCVFLFLRWGLWYVHFHSCAEQLFLLLIDGEALESNSSQIQLRRVRRVCGCISWGPSHQWYCWQCLIWAHSNLYWVLTHPNLICGWHCSCTQITSNSNVDTRPRA